MEVPSSMAEDLCDLLASFFDTDASSQALAVVEALSCQPEHRYEIARSNAMGGILSILDFQMDDDDDDDDDDGFLLQIALSILRNLSSTNHIDHPDELIPKLVPLLEETTLSTHCILILKNLCERASGRKSVAETEGCISSVALLLEAEDRKAQEHAVSVLHSLCCHRANYREMVMKEGVIPGLVHVSVNGNRRAKATASEVLRVLKNEFSRSGEISGGGGGGTEGRDEKNVDNGSIVRMKESGPSKTQGLFCNIFCRPTGMAAVKKKKKKKKN
ncbi:hypothetical protein M569_11288 [Genlisea aurea]|uniref:U-box domain-containing protein n=1 Tax=Genlisea aurea TaxID=192259 RepID=S8DKX2_9LAMI|nr:hypothetical protein M569_11288 [Genlisea aurea]